MRSSEQNSLRLTDKLEALNESFLQLEGHVQIMKDKLMMAESENEKISRSLSAMDIKLRDKERTILDQAERENCLRKEYEELKKKDIRKDK